MLENGLASVNREKWEYFTPAKQVSYQSVCLIVECMAITVIYFLTVLLTAIFKSGHHHQWFY